MKTRLTLLILFLISCTNGQIQIPYLDDIDSINITDNKNDFSYSETDKKIIEEFKRILKEKPEKNNCHFDGSIQFMKGYEIRLEVFFSISSPDCQFLITNDDEKQWGYRLNYQSGMYLSEYFYGVKMKDNVNH